MRSVIVCMYVYLFFYYSNIDKYKNKGFNSNDFCSHIFMTLFYNKGKIMSYYILATDT